MQSHYYLSVRLLAAALGSLAFSSVSVADSPWYVAPQLGVVSPDDDRGELSNGSLAGLSIGYEIGQRWAAELRAATYSLNGEPDDRETDQTTVGVDLLWYPFGQVGENALFRPYLLIGAGVASTDIGDNFSSDNAITSIGAGASIKLFDTGLSLRGEARYVTDFVDAEDASSFSDIQGTVGIKVPLGGLTETAASPEVVRPEPAAIEDDPVDEPAAQPEEVDEPELVPEPAPEDYSPFGSNGSSRAIPAEAPPAEPEVVEPEVAEPKVVEPKVVEKPAQQEKPKAKPLAASKAPAPEVAAKPAAPTTTATKKASPPPPVSQPASKPVAQPAPRNASAAKTLGSGIADDDGDGIRNAVDLCPGTASGGYVDADGCPLQLAQKRTPAKRKPVAAAPTKAPAKPIAKPPIKAAATGNIKKPKEAAKPAAGKVTTMQLKGVTFASGSSKLNPGSEKVIARVAALMQKKQSLQVEVGGHSDNRGNKQANRQLSEDRANAVKQALVEQGIAANRITAKGYGDSNPIASNDTTEGRKQNRRIELRLQR